MKGLIVFLIRLVVGGGLAALLTRFFHPDQGLLAVAGLALVLVGLAYFFDYMRQKKSGQ